MPVRQLAPDIFQITLPTPFPVGPVHAYLLWGDPLTLVDTGVYDRASEAALRAALAELGVAPQDLQQIVISHSHLDHVGQARWLAAAGGADVLAHPLAVARIADFHGHAARAMAWSDQLLAQGGAPPEQWPMAQAFYAIIPRLTEDVAVQRCLDEGDTLRAGGKEWQVLFCPGHSSDLICLYRPQQRLLISSDHLIAHISSNALVEPPQPGQTARRLPLIEYWQALERVAALDLDQVLPGHGEVITDHRALLAARREQRERRLQRIAAAVDGTALTAWQVVQAIFPNLAGVDIFLGLSEAIGHLDMLMAQGRVTAQQETEGGEIRYQGV